ncbi:beta-phosphoglucomutase family hydrolase [Mycolicibacterium sp.]|uniref:beta-phosphoglucomutase family hydrolase n=1 Tax=Mycolicibacterium sp. TaxID=2320850 RepID=UPI0028A5CC66|nr:beta-phosphoglucomutase family hydrolase [Mycolicibacterium sp.]
MLHNSLRHLGLPDRIRACLFDLDGVLTDTASLHTRAWQAMFDEYLGAHGQPKFDPAADYQKYVDGRKRDDGVRCFLASRAITLPDGSPDDPPDRDTVNGLANRKNEVFQAVLHRDGITVFDGSRRYLQAVADARVPAAVVSSSANTAQVLELTGLDRYLPVRVDGVTMREQHIPGKPEPDSFLLAAQLLGVPPEQAAVFEDALSGVRAGRRGGFGCVVGVDRVGQTEALRREGADVVVQDLADLLGDL